MDLKVTFIVDPVYKSFLTEPELYDFEPSEYNKHYILTADAADVYEMLDR